MTGYFAHLWRSHEGGRKSCGIHHLDRHRQRDTKDWVQIWRDSPEATGIQQRVTASKQQQQVPERSLHNRAPLQLLNNWIRELLHNRRIHILYVPAALPIRYRPLLPNGTFFPQPHDGRLRKLTLLGYPAHLLRSPSPSQRHE